MISPAAFNVTRRGVLGVTASAAGMVLSWRAGAALAATGAAINSPRISPFLALHADGKAVFYLPSAEMGQDVYTTLAKIFADEARLAWPALTVEFAPHSREFYNQLGNQATGGSRTVRQWYPRLRQAGAAVRQAFLVAAATSLKQPESELRVADSTIVHSASGQRMTYHQLAPLLEGKPLAVNPPLLPNTAHQLIGHDVPRRDTLAKITGTAQFGADVRMPGQVYAAVAMLPEWLGGIDDVTMPNKLGAGIIGTHRFENAVAIVARTWAAASKAAAQIELTAKASSADALDDQAIARVLADTEANKPGNIVSKHGDVAAELASGTRFEATYQVPYIAHACMETMVATASVGDGKAHVIVPTQASDRVAQIVAELLGLTTDKVLVENTFLGGGFGRKGTDFQVVRQAVLLAQKFKRPVQVMWDRETDTRNDLYRPAARFNYEAALAGGKITAIRTRSAMQSTRKQRFPKFYKPSAHEAPEDLFPYASTAAEHRWIEADLPIAVGYWRSIDNSHYPFATESFVDELAHRAGLDPLAFRLAHLADRPRAATVLRAAADMAKWGAPLPPGTGLGIALIEAWDSACAQVARVMMIAGKPRVDKIWAAVDCGFAVSPQGVRDQVEGAIVYALTATLHGQMTIKGGQMAQSSFDDYPVLTMAEMPAIEVRILPSSASPGGVGELGTPCVAPAVANAIFAASGQRLRNLPISPA